MGGHELLVGGFEVKAMGLSGKPDGAALEKLGAAVFGIPLGTSRDEMSVVFRENVCQHFEPQSIRF